MKELSLEDRLEITRGIMNLLETWQVAAADRIALLGLPSSTRVREIRKFEQDKPLPHEEYIYQRIEHFAGIAEALRTSYPLNAAMGNIWMNRRNKRFGDRTPVRCMVEDGINGVVAVRTHLDCSYDWFVDANQSKLTD